MYSETLDMTFSTATMPTAREEETETYSSFSVKLRDYQKQLVDYVLALEPRKRCCLWLPTGAGKTEVACAIAERAKGKVLFIVERIVLARQAEARFERYGMIPDYIQGENTVFRNLSRVIVASIQSLRSRKDRFLIPWHEIEYVIVDEAHIIHKEHFEVIKRCHNAKIIGLTATPIRRGMKELYHECKQSITYRELIEQGFLVKPTYYAPCEETLKAIRNVKVSATGDYATPELSKACVAIAGDIVTWWKKLAEGRQTIVFCVDIKHSIKVAETFLAAGVSVEQIDCHTSDEDRQRTFEEFRMGAVQVLTSVNVLSLGFDEPVASCAILARPTLSQILHIQQVGRVLRPCDGKEDAIIIDHAGNCLKHGLVEDFCPPPSLPDETARGAGFRKKKDPPATKACRNCQAVNPYRAVVCEKCGAPFERRGKKIIEITSRLQKVGGEVLGQTQKEVKSYYLQALYVARQFGWKDGWAYYKTKSKFGENVKVEYSWKNLTPIKPYDFGLLRLLSKSFWRSRV